MAGVKGRATTAQVSTGTSAKTILQLVAATNQRVLVPRIIVSFESIVATDAPIQVVVRRQSTAGTMSALTPSKYNDSDDETLQTTALHTASAEPTSGDILETQLIHPQGRGVFGPFEIKGGGRLGVVVTAGVSVDCVVCAHFEE
jgi:hypothetical protein